MVLCLARLAQDRHSHGMNAAEPLWLSMAAYAVGTSITPGPNNTMLLASGVNVGFRATLPLVLGINLVGDGIRDVTAPDAAVADAPCQ